jgi:hypothetical protein
VVSLTVELVVGVSEVARAVVRVTVVTGAVVVLAVVRVDLLVVLGVLVAWVVWRDVAEEMEISSLWAAGSWVVAC